MEASDKDRAILTAKIKKWTGPRYPDVLNESEIFAAEISSLEGFAVVETPDATQHVGRVIVDGVLQKGHQYEKSVRPAVESISRFDQAATLDGFVSLVEPRPIFHVLPNQWMSSTKKNLLEVAGFFLDRGVNSFDSLRDWLEPEDQRDLLLTRNSGLAFTMADKTADYFRLLTGHWDAVAVDAGLHGLLNKWNGLPMSRNSVRWPYKHKRSIIQLAALRLGWTPRDLDHACYRLTQQKLRGDV